MAGEPILIVEDNPGNLKLLKLALTIEGYDIRAAKNAEETIEILQTFNPRLILMDIQLPGKDGLQLSQELKANALYRDIIIVAITAYAMKNDKEKILAAGCDGYIPKPIDIKALPQIIAGYLNKATVRI